MAVLVAAGFWMFWPTIGALIQELTPGTEYVRANTLLLAGVQGGWLLAGALVGFVYNHIGLGWILVIDFATYMVSFLCYLAVRRGRHVVKPPQPAAVGQAGDHATENQKTAWGKYVHELLEGVRYVKARPQLILLGTSMALFLGAMLTQGVVHGAAQRSHPEGGGGRLWLAEWKLGCRRVSERHVCAGSDCPAAIASRRRNITRRAGVVSGPAAIFTHSGDGRFLLPPNGIGARYQWNGYLQRDYGIVPRHFMGRVQNTFYFAGTLLQLAMGIGVAAVAHRISLPAAFAIVGGVYLVACLSAAWPVARHSDVPQQAAQAAAE